MAFVSRDGGGTINGVYANKQDNASEVLPDTDPAVIAFFAPKVIDPIDAWDVVSFKISFNHENRIRALEGKSAITAAQFKTAVKGLL